MKLTMTQVAMLAIVSTQLPVTSQAATEADAIQACAVAFTQKLEESRNTKLRMRVDEASKGSNSSLDSVTVINLTVFNADGMQQLAKAECYVNSRAEVRSVRQVG